MYVRMYQITASILYSADLFLSREHKRDVFVVLHNRLSCHIVPKLVTANLCRHAYKKYRYIVCSIIYS